MADIDAIVKGLFEKSKRDIAKALTIVESSSEDSKKLLKLISQKTGNAHIVGFTGVGGSGKSSLINSVIKEYRKQGKKVGILAVDPSSPYTGGAILGDRIRMQDHFTDNDVFIRSMATRGQLGGLSKEMYNAIQVLDAAGFDKILVETIGIGQDEVDIVKVADTSIVVLTPGYGDDIQALKAGIMEIADIFAINKSDKDGADKVRLQIEMALNLNEKAKKQPAIYNTVAIQHKGTGELVKGIDEHLEYLKKENLLEPKRKERIKIGIYNIISSELRKLIEGKLDLGQATDLVYKKEKDPYTIIEEALKSVTIATSQ